jgi:hypothetical protein
MLIPHKPSKALRRSGQGNQPRDGLEDVHILEYPGPEAEDKPKADEPGTATPSGRTRVWSPFAQ